MSRFPMCRRRSLLLIVGLWLCAESAVVAFDFSSAVPDVSVTLFGTTVTYEVTDPISGELKTGSTNTPGVVNPPVPAGGVVAWVAGKTVHYRIYDVGRGVWAADFTSAPSAMAVSDPVNSQGIVAWSADQTVYYTMYDPELGQWMTASKPPSGFVYEVKVSDGMAAWVAGQTTVYYRTYDPAAGAWRGGNVSSPGAPAISDLTVSNGVAAWSANTTVFARVYDHVAGAWRDTNVVGPGYITELGVTNGTVSWNSGTQKFTLGYNPNTNAWRAGTALPRANFAAYPTAGNAPVTVWFADLSLAANTWSWDFGDGTTSPARTPYHRFTDFARYTVTQTVSGPAGTRSTNQVILADTNAPTGSLSINGGQPHTPFVNVMLTVSATDNSSNVTRMRFSNQTTNAWTAWEPYATSKAWTLTSGDGLKTVYASFRDAAANTSAAARATITLDTRVPGVSFLSTNFAVPEASRVATITVMLSAPSVFTAAVDYATSDGTATAGSDYEPASGRLIFLPGQTFKTFTVGIAEDALPEPNETILLTLSNPTNAVIGSSAIVTLQDEDLPAVAFSSSTYSLGEDLGQAVINVLLSAAAGRTVTVECATAPGTAAAGLDYTAVTNVLTFPPGETEQAVVVPVVNDSVDEPDETVLLRLFSPTNATLGAVSNAALTIIDDDPPTVFFGSPAFFVAESAGSIAIPVLLSSAYTQMVAVGYQSFNGSASVGSDYVAASGTLPFFPGQTNQTFSVTLMPDALAESIETVFLVLTNHYIATPGVPSEATLYILDNAAGPLLWSPLWMPDRSFQFTVVAPTGQTYAVEASTNLSSWTELTLRLQTNMMQASRDTNATNFPRRFYRARQAN